MHYPGGKARSFQHVLNLMPPHEVYIEAFLGVGSVMRNKRPAHTEIGIDLDERALALCGLKDRGATLIKADGIEFLKSYAFKGNEVVYCDPPYLPSTRKRTKVYRFDTDEAQHRRLLTIIQNINAKVLISGYDSNLYSEALSTWNIHRFQAKTHTVFREECIWYNFDPPTALHDYRYLGSNFRERQTTKRRLNRLKNRISTLPELEQEHLKEWLTNRRHTSAT